MSDLWSVDDMIAAMHARPTGKLPKSVGGISIDTRTLNKGDAFFAIRGDRFDGHDFVRDAVKAGAGVAIVAEEKLVALGHLSVPLLVVRDVLGALADLARAARERSAAKIIAVTGSVGKTSTKEMLRAALAPSGEVHASAASFNNHWGVPLSLARLPQEARFAVFEIGMNHAGEIRPLVKLVRPQVAIVTNVGAAHMGAFRSQADIARAKAEIFEGVEQGGVALINRDNRHFRLLSEKAAEAGIADIRAFGKRAGSTLRLRRITDALHCSVIEAELASEPVTYKVGAPGLHLAMNSLAVMGAVQAVGGDLTKAALALAAIEPEKGRGRRHVLTHPNGEFLLIDESYNANQSSIEATLAVLGKAPVSGRGRRIAVLGDMLELGRHSARLHRELAKPIAANGIDLVLLVGNEMRHLAQVLPPAKLGGHFASAAQVVSGLRDSLRGGDAVMLKASNGIGFGAVVEAIRKAYPAAQAAAE